MIVLGIESSCDETAAAIVNDKKEILGQCLLTQLDEHKPFGGVVPEIAARSHLEHIDEIIEHTFKNAGLKPQDVDAIAAASGRTPDRQRLLSISVAFGLRRPLPNSDCQRRR